MEIIYKILNDFSVLNSPSGRAIPFPVSFGPNNEMHMAQLKHFIACIEGREQPICPLDEAVRILETTLG